MKCNHCKKIIPHREEIIIDKKDKKQYLHEACWTKLEQKAKEKAFQSFQREARVKKMVAHTGLGLAALLLLLGIWAYKRVRVVAANYEIPRFFLLSGGVLALTIGVFWMTTAWIVLWIIPCLSFFIFSFF